MTAAGADLPAGPDDGLVGATIELSVGGVAHGGCFIAREPGGRVVFVRHALPGERVRAVVTEEHASYLRADAVEIVHASPHRVSPPCPYAGACGGCDLQHADLVYQRELKTAVVREQLRRLGGLSPSDVDELDPTVRPVPAVPGEPDGQGWRTRVRYTVDSTGRAGLLAHRSHEVVPVDRCLIAHQAIRATDVLRRTWPDHDAVEVVAGASGEAVIVPLASARMRSARAAPAETAGATVTEHAVGRRWTLPPTVFWQVHPAAAGTLAADVVDLLRPRPGDRVWDLYGGAGLFAAAVAPHVSSMGQIAGQITIVESDPAAVAAARRCLHDVPSVTVVHADVAAALRNRRWRSVDAVVLDPPRSGAGPAVVKGIAAHSPRVVVYVACDPAALARDVRTFRAYGYDLSGLRAYDLFPHTHHVECVAAFTAR